MTEEEKKARSAEERAAEQTGTPRTMSAVAETPAEAAATEGEEGASAPEAPAEAPVEQAPAAAPASPTAREQWMNSYREDNPDMDADDEEALYSQANRNYDELKRSRETSRNLDEALGKFPGLNDMVVLASRGEDPFVWLAENLGMDIRDIADDPDFAQKLGEALAKYHQKEADEADEQSRSKEDAEAYGQQLQQNYIDSANQLAELQQEKGLTDEECEEVFGHFFRDIVKDAREGIVSKDTWKAILNARSYDADMEAARKDGATKALNEKFQNRVQGARTPGEIPPSAPGAGGRGSSRQRGFFAGVE